MDSQGLLNGSELAGRALLGLLFLTEGVSKLVGYSGAVRYAVAFGLPSQLLPAAIAVELGAGLLVVLGWHTRVAALGLAAFCIFAATIFHTKFGDRNQVIHFEKNLALAGAFLVLWARGAGACSLDALLSRTVRHTPHRASLYDVFGRVVSRRPDARCRQPESTRALPPE